MWIEMLKSKIHRAVVTDANLNYKGSITLDEDLIDAAGLRVHEKVSVVNNNNGERFETVRDSWRKGLGNCLPEWSCGSKGSSGRCHYCDELCTDDTRGGRQFRTGNSELGWKNKSNCKIVNIIYRRQPLKPTSVESSRRFF